MVFTALFLVTISKSYTAIHFRKIFAFRYTREKSLYDLKFYKTKNEYVLYLKQRRTAKHNLVQLNVAL